MVFLKVLALLLLSQHLSCAFAAEQKAYELRAQMQKENARPDLIYEILDVDCTVCIPVGVEIYKSGLIVRYSATKGIRGMCVMKPEALQVISEVRQSLSSGVLKEQCRTWTVWSNGLIPVVRLSVLDGSNYVVCKVGVTSVSAQVSSEVLDKLAYGECT